jgi:hypothetical protein
MTDTAAPPGLSASVKIGAVGDPSCDGRKCHWQINDVVATDLEWVSGKGGQVRVPARADGS